VIAARMSFWGNRKWGCHALFKNFFEGLIGHMREKYRDDSWRVWNGFLILVGPLFVHGLVHSEMMWR